MESPVGQHCLAFSEPDHGSDLAAVETVGQVIGNEVVVTGVKVWLAGADLATTALVLCQTETTAPRYQNLSCVLVPLHDNNVALRPLRTLSGDTDCFEAVFDAARAPLSNIVGGRGNGWRVAMTSLAAARSNPATLRTGELEDEFWEVVELARHYGRDRDPVARQQLASAYAQVRILRIHKSRAEPGPGASVTNVLWSACRRRLGEIAMDVMGPDSLLRPDGEAYATSRWQHLFLTSRADTIRLGTTEIQRNIIAERVLGLPK